MPTLHTVRRILALDLGLSAQAIESCLRSASLIDAEISDRTEVSLAEALRVVAFGEALVGAGTK